MKLCINNIKTKAVKITPEEDRVLSDAMSFYVPKYQFMPRYLTGKWDGKKRFYHRGLKTFPTGLLPFVLQLAKKHKLKIKLEDTRKTKHVIKPKRLKKALALLRDYQRPELLKILNTELKGLPWVRGIVKFPTGGGKTALAAAFIKAINAWTLFIVGRLDLVYQTKEVFESVLKQEIGVIGDSKFTIKKVTIATPQTLANKIKAMQPYLDKIKVLIIDEAHHVAAGQYHQIAEACPAFYRLGLTASPLARGDLGDVTLVGDTGEIISELNRKKLEKAGWLSKPTIYLTEIADPPIKARLPYDKIYKYGIVQNDERLQVIVDQAIEACKKRKEHVLILVRQLRHGRRIRNRLKPLVPVVFLRGASSIQRRRAIIKRVNSSSNPMVVVASDIFSEGVDVPEFRCLILAGGGASRIKSIQRIGRGLRPKKDGNNRLTVIDFIDRTHESLERQSGERIAAYQAEGFKIVREK